MSRLDRIIDIVILVGTPFACLSLALATNWAGVIWSALAYSYYLELRAALRRRKPVYKITITPDTRAFEKAMADIARSARGIR